MEKELKTTDVKDVYKAILQLKTVPECEKFFRDLCTLAEIKAIAERWSVVRKLDNNIPYRKIYQETGVSTATITRIAHWLHHGHGGYKLILNRM